MTTCVLQGQTQCVAAVDAADGRAPDHPAATCSARSTTASAAAPNAQVVVLGYPVFYQLGVDLRGAQRHLAARRSTPGINLVDDITRTTAQQYGFTFADVRSIFVGHQLCSGDKWIHALNFADIGSRTTRSPRGTPAATTR